MSKKHNSRPRGNGGRRSFTSFSMSCALAKAGVSRESVIPEERKVQYATATR